MSFIKNLEQSLDFDYSVNEVKIATMADFEKFIKNRVDGNFGKIFYRGERCDDLMRPLAPTILRHREYLKNPGNSPFAEINSDYLLEYYKHRGDYFKIYTRLFGTASKYRLYNLCAFSQHYLNLSPLIDFTKSLYVALSFAMKGNPNPKEDIVLYTAQIEDNDNYTNDLVTAECWMSDYHVRVFMPQEGQSIVKSPFKMAEYSREASTLSPVAKMIDIPTNDRMKFQQGVFLYLNSFTVFTNSYLTKNVRDDLKINKYIISRAICPRLYEMLNSEAPWYDYECLSDIARGIKRAANDFDSIKEI